MMRHLLAGLILVFFVWTPVLGQAPPAATVSDLAWMAGHYAGNTGNGTLEENWTEPEGGSMAALVRSTGDGATNMIELIVIEEEGDSLTLRLKQWDPGMEPRAEGFQVMELMEIGDKKVVFKNSGSGGLQQLAYSLAGDEFTISVQTAQGAFDIPLTRRAAH
jgi:hypothetical protein